MFKVDFKKNYNSLSQNFLEHMMLCMGSCQTWMYLIEECIYNNTMSILVNRNSTSNFKFSHGLHQRDSFAPFLFLIDIGSTLSCKIGV